MPTRSRPRRSPLVLLTERLVRTDPPPFEQVYAVVGPSERPRVQPAVQPPHLEELVGFRAPEAWSGIAVLADGTARHVSTDVTDGTTDRVRIAYAVDRHGNEGAAVTSQDSGACWSSPDAVDGFVADLCRRMLGLACPPERRKPADLAAAAWLELLLDRAADPLTADTVRTWGDVAALHPTLDGEPAATPDRLAHLVRATTDLWDWEQVRAAVATGALAVDQVGPDLAIWMDAPFLARWLLGMHRPIGELLDDLRLFLDERLHHDVSTTLVHCGVDP